MARPETFKTPLGRRLADVRKAVGHPERKTFADILEMKPDTLGTYERGISEPDAELFAKYRERFGVNLSWLITGKGTMFDDPAKVPAPPIQIDQKTLQQLVDKVDEVNDKVDEVREAARPRSRTQRFEPRPPATMKWYPVPLSAGGGSISPYEAPGADLNMEELASELLGIPIAAIRIFRIRGDSMLPTFVDGDLVVIDSRSTFPDDNGIYAFSWNGETYAKRAQWLEANRLLWKSDNEDNHHAAFEVAGEELPTMSIFGRVVWVWKPV